MAAIGAFVQITLFDQPKFFTPTPRAVPPFGPEEGLHALDAFDFRGEQRFDSTLREARAEQFPVVASGLRKDTFQHAMRTLLTHCC